MKRRKKNLWQRTCRFLCACMIALLLPGTVFAAGEVDDATAGETSLTLHYTAGAGVFSFYKIAAFSETGEFTLEDSFTDYAQTVTNLDELNHLDSLTAGEWNDLASTLSDLVMNKEIPSVYQADTDADGNLVWSDIPKGLYLITGERTQDEQYIYTPNPTLVTVPNRDEAGNWDCHPVIEYSKYEKEEISEEPVSYQVKKIWVDENYEDQRPESIQVKLLQDGEEYQTITLNLDNNWEYTWTELEAGHEWNVEELNLPDSYTMSSTKDGTRFIITNTYKKSGASVPSKNTNTKLPQTGQLWWPVPIMAFLGIVAFMIGWVWRREQDA